MNVTLKIKLYPNEKQRQVLDNHFNAYRFIYNLSLEYKTTLWKNWKVNKSKYDIAKEVLEIRRGTDWLMKCKAECLREAAHEMDKSYQKFFSGSGFPKFKSKRGEQSFHAYQTLSCKHGKLMFFKNSIKYKTSTYYKNILENTKIKKVTFKKDLCGDYWASCLVEIIPPVIDKFKNDIIGLDLGIKSFVITSEGDVYHNNRYLTIYQSKLKKLQRRFSKTKRGSCNREKIRLKIAKLYRKICRQKEHYYHKVSNDIIRDNQTIVIETLQIQNMKKNRKLSKSIQEVSWGLFIRMLEYKSNMYGRKLIKINTFYPSSKMCSQCGNIKGDLTLKDRDYECESCGIIIDRDLNASINIRNAGIKIPEVPVEDMTMVNPKKQELTDLITY